MLLEGVTEKITRIVTYNKKVKRFKGKRGLNLLNVSDTKAKFSI